MTETPSLQIARLIVDAARAGGFLDSPIATIPELAEEEKKLFIRIMGAMDRHCGPGKDTLSHEEIESMFTFVLVKAAELVPMHICNKMEDPSLDGLFDGKIPVYADDTTMAFCRKCAWPATAGAAFLNARLPEDANPMLCLLEALKWTFRIAQHLVILEIESRHGAGNPPESSAQ